MGLRKKINKTGNSKPYTKLIQKNSEDSHQTSPSWVVTFVRFDTRDTKNYQQRSDSQNNILETRKPLVVENDCISVNVNQSKTNPTPKATLTLMSGDLNYATAVSPGDFFLVNIVNDLGKSRNIAQRASKSKPINKIGDGFKGIFKVNTINKIIQADPNSGQKVLRYQIAGYAFTEFNNIIYFNPSLGDSFGANAQLMNINLDLLEVISSKKTVQEALERLPNIILGGNTINPTNITTLFKQSYEVPGLVFQLMGIDGRYAIDLYKVMIGVWDSFGGKATPEEGLNPNYTSNGSIQTTRTSLLGKIPIHTTALTGVTLTELMKRFLNELINEMYMCFRVDRETKSLLPKLILRQKPFNTEHSQKTEPGQREIKGTRFLQLPRWKVSPDLITAINVSKNESLRFNFVHIMGTTGENEKDKQFLALQNGSAGNIIKDDIDIRRHGLRPYVRISNFDWVEGEATIGMSADWAALCFDWVYGGHLKLNGNIECVGIEEDICIGDNFELQHTVYHIESISHTATITPDGRKSFKTSLQVSNGVDKRSNKSGPIYPEMDFTDTYTDRKDDYKNYQILPGFSDTQSILGRPKGGEEVKETKERSFTPLSIKNKETKE